MINEEKFKTEIIKDAEKYVEKVFNEDFSGHDFFHTMRVYRTATYIAEKENADIFIVQLAALLHDVDDRKLSPKTTANKDRAVLFMKSKNISDALCKSIVSIIAEVSYAGKDSKTPSLIEGMCVQDADRLDALGAIGIARAFAYGGSRHRQMYNPVVKPCMDMGKEEYQNHVSTTINHFYEKLFYLKDLMNTATAKKIAEKRELYMKDFVLEFLNEWELKDL
ncbi:HD domain-containing protein [Treponema sp. OMZ 792]|uniref:HD domain-containing protein n=1 Tax=unclassified Treponema TaxID=2638727 RepID=UPI0020A247E2|nr:MULTISPECIES: HD domain-containing protein [unclassified Treponema]UTC67912.1 HD domain-containing protein [Treponema sp. OMZ 789]UTC70633.1 HD domain-containing protein [Treponema sp. OMZ 790]UTC73357.1 HD domain-containing protein [Treponema sp. OMZ 791]UTC76013.1 HD domain-containing protein [Treponema sp. OMZ 792]UTC80015.1 HD domain-containing protein [Treponema sp. OMZ 798]